jgi:hypothetical protein
MCSAWSLTYLQTKAYEEAYAFSTKAWVSAEISSAILKGGGFLDRA